MRIMVTGGRDWSDEATIRSALAEFSGDVTLIHGACPWGADAIADRVARELGFRVVEFHADWSKHGPAAGPIRNAAMARSRPDVVLAFPTPRSRGTWDAVHRARKAGIDVRVFALRS